MYRIIGVDGREYGPVSAEQLRRWIAEGRANSETQVAVEGSIAWRALGSFPEFSPAFGPASAPRIGPPPAVLAGAPPVRRTNGLAVTGLVLGIFSITVGFCCCYGIPFNLLGLIFSGVALMQINQYPQLYNGRGTATAGLIISAFSLLLAAILFLVFGSIAAWTEPGGYHRYRL